MGGCFPCFGSSNNKEGGGQGKREVNSKRDSSSVKDGSAAVAQSRHHVSRVNSGKRPKKLGEIDLLAWKRKRFVFWSYFVVDGDAVIAGFLGRVLSDGNLGSLSEVAFPLI